jgi:hypothetical protein
MYAAATTRGIEAPDRTTEMDSVARDWLASSFSCSVWEDEPSLGEAIQLSADLSKYAVESDGFVSGAWFTYSQGAISVDMVITAYETAAADDPHVYEGTRCRLRVFGNVVVRRRVASVGPNAGAAAAIGGVAAVPQYGTWDQNPFQFGRSTVLAHMSPPTYFPMNTFELPGNVFAAPQGDSSSSPYTTYTSEAVPAWPNNAVPSIVKWDQSPPIAIADGTVRNESAVSVPLTNNDFDAATFSPTGGTLLYPRRSVQATQAMRFRDYDIPTGIVAASGGMFSFASIAPQGLYSSHPNQHRFSFSGSATSTRTYGAAGNVSFHVTPEISIVW